VEVTVLYYTGNHEDGTFESNIIANLVKNCGDLPIVSVSQKPLKLGRNICVGEKPYSYTSEFMQIRIGLESITTPYVLTAESDFLYPPEYFQFTPTIAGKCHRYYGVWIAYDKFHMKGCSDGAQLVDRLLWLDLINKALPSRDDWNQEMLQRCQPSPTDWKITWTSDNPAISFKTGRNVNNLTRLKKDIPATKVLPYWGDIKSLKEKMYEQNT
jgi:hypothetical protein